MGTVFLLARIRRRMLDVGRKGSPTRGLAARPIFGKPAGIRNPSNAMPTAAFPKGGGASCRVSRLVHLRDGRLFGVRLLAATSPSSRGSCLVSHRRAVSYFPRGTYLSYCMRTLRLRPSKAYPDKFECSICGELFDVRPFSPDEELNKRFEEHVREKHPESERQR
jgi:hypothetical protein